VGAEVEMAVAMLRDASVERQSRFIHGKNQLVQENLNIMVNVNIYRKTHCRKTNFWEVILNLELLTSSTSTPSMATFRSTRF